ncbi:hypothetical protein JB92DRAFT_124386 [Gautieria morchelliformis]|nr:hypothetical protein JB92DRAFT_124386 [Gautieria morchelliformis]
MFFSPAELTDDTRAPRRKTSASSSPTDRAAPDPAPSDLRLVVCGNDKAVHFFDVDLRNPPLDHQRLRECGFLRLDTCVNHASISPDGRTLLCVGDTPHAYLFRIIPGAFVACEPLATYIFPMLPYEDQSCLVPCNDPPSYVSLRPRTYRPTIHTYSTIHSSMAPRACFATAWTSDGLKFAVAAQEGALAVWDVRSSVPIWAFWSGLRAPSVQQHRARRRARAAPTNWWGANASDGESSWGGANSATGEPAADASDAAPAAAGANPGGPPGPPPPRLPRVGALSFPPEGNAGSSAASSPTVRVPTTRHMFPPVTLPMPAVVSEPEPEAPTGTWADEPGVMRTPFGDWVVDENGPDNGIRNLQFSTGDAGRELCVFVEHTTNIHVIDARTFDPLTHRMFEFPDVDEMFAATSAEPAADPSAAACPHAEAAPVPAADAAAPSADAAAAVPENAAALGASPASPAEVQMASADDETSTVGTRNGTPAPNRRRSVDEAHRGFRWEDLVAEGLAVDRVYPLIPDVRGVQTSPEREEGEEQAIAGVMRPVTPEADATPEVHDATGEMESMTAAAAPGGVQETEASAELAQLIARQDTPSVDAREATPEPDGPAETHPSDEMSMVANGAPVRGGRAGAGTPPLELFDPREFSQWLSDTDPAPAASQEAPGRRARDVPMGDTRADGWTVRVHSNPPAALPGQTVFTIRPTTPSSATPSRAQPVAPTQPPTCTSLR